MKSLVLLVNVVLAQKFRSSKGGLMLGAQKPARVDTDIMSLELLLPPSA